MKRRPPEGRQAEKPEKPRRSIRRTFRRVAAGVLLTATLGYSGLLLSYSGAGETLTPGEAALVESVFGDEVNTSKIRKHFKEKGHITHLLRGKRGTVLPPHSHIDFFGADAASEDFSRDHADQSGFFMHEVTHVWQNQNRAWRLSKLHICRKYDYELTPQAAFCDFGVEQQAEIIEAYVEKWLHKESPARTGETMTAQDSLLLKVVETRFPQARKTRLSLQAGS